MQSAKARARVVLLFAAVLLAFHSNLNTAHAQTCGANYVIKGGEVLSDVAGKAYGNSMMWAVLFYANQDLMGANSQGFVQGLTIKVPCLPGQTPLPAPQEASTPVPTTDNDMEISPTVRRIDFLTADGFAPFADRASPDGGMMTRIVASAMDLIRERSGGTFEYKISWVNDWGAHLNTLLVTRAFDVGFPWVKPDCNRGPELSQDAKYRCQRFFFSDPVYEVFTVLFVPAASTINFVKDDDIVGKSVCQPANATTYELDKGGRNWVKDNKIVLLKPQSLDECFKLLDAGTVNAVVAPDLTGRAAISALGLDAKVKALPRPVDIGTLHLVVPKTHPQASTVIYYLNASIARLRESGEFDRIVDKQLSRFWASAERR